MKNTIMKSSRDHCFKYVFLLPVISAILVNLSTKFYAPLLGWIAMVPFFYSILKLESKFKLIFYGNVIYSTILYLFLINDTFETYTHIFQGNNVYALFAYLLSVLFPVSIVCIVTYIIYKLFNKNNKSYLLITLITIFNLLLPQLILQFFFSGFMWIVFHYAYCILKNDSLIQLSSFLNINFISSIVLVINGFLAINFINKKKNFLCYNILLIVVLYLSGYYLKISNVEVCENYLNIATITPNTRVDDDVWSNKNLDVIINKYFSELNALKNKKVDMIVWTEATVPWTFQEDDPFYLKLKDYTSLYEIPQVIGMNTLIGKNKVYSSSYYIGIEKSIQRQDKIQLLSIAEKQIDLFGDVTTKIMGLQVEPGKTRTIFELNGVKFGVIICNEILYPYEIKQIKENGANFIVAIGNGNWFSENGNVNRLLKLNARIRAVENNIPIIYNSNIGGVLFVDNQGIIKYEEQSKEVFSHIEQININTL